MCGCCTSNNIIELTQTQSTSYHSSLCIFGSFSKYYNHKKKYELVSKLGKGAYGKVNLFRDKELKDIHYAIKTLKKNLLKPSSLTYIKNEVEIISSLDHPNIVRYFETYEDITQLHIVMEYVPGDNLHMLMKTKVTFTEKEMAEIVYCLLKAVYFLHQNGIVHRDIKPENILFCETDDLNSLKLIDFGLAISEKDKKDAHTVGTPYYMAPEAIKGQISFESDIWPIGVILYIMVTGQRPFQGKSKTETFENIIAENYDKKLLKSLSISDELKDFIKKILIANPKKRITIETALKHKWFQQTLQKTNILTCPKYHFDTKIIDYLIAFKNRTCIQKEILYYIAKIAKYKDIKQLTEAFNEIDIHLTGVIQKEEIEKLFQKKGKKENINIIYGSLDFHNDKKIKYSEFIAATLQSLNYVDEERLLSAFRYFDVKNEGFITSFLFVEVLKQNNVQVNEELIYNDFRVLNLSKEHKIDFEQFKYIFYYRNAN